MKKILCVSIAALLLGSTLSLSACAPKDTAAPNNSTAPSEMAATDDIRSTTESTAPTPIVNLDELPFDTSFNGLPVFPYGSTVYTQRYVAEADAPDDGVWELAALDTNYEYAETIGSNVTKSNATVFYAIPGMVLATSYDGTDCIDVETNEITSRFDGIVRYVDYANSKVYYSTIYNPDKEPELFVMSFGETEGRMVADESYTYLDTIDGVMYLSTTNQAKDVILHTMRTGEEPMPLATLPAFGNVAEVENYPSINQVQHLTVCGNRIVATYGTFEGSLGYYIGRIVSMDMDGSNLIAEEFDELSPFFEVIGDSLYITAAQYDADDNMEYGILRVSADLTEREMLLRGGQQLASRGDLLLYKALGEAGTGESDLCLYNASTGESDIVMSSGALPTFADSEYINFRNTKFCGDFVYVDVLVNAYTPASDTWRGHTAYEAGMLARLDFSEIIFIGEAFYDEPVSIGS